MSNTGSDSDQGHMRRQDASPGNAVADRDGEVECGHVGCRGRQWCHVQR